MSSYKMTYGRKFWGMIIGILVLAGALVFAGLVVPTAIDASVVITFFFLVGFLVVAYIGGNVFNNFTKSKFFSSERYTGEEK